MYKLRYRGYVYDTDTGLYYLQSRYYDPQTGRFINADDTAYVDTNSGTTLSTNMFAYCENNHINNVDYTGQWYHNLSSYYKAHKKMYEGYPDAWQAFCTRYNKLKKRYKDNRSALGRFSGYIYGQKTRKLKI
ncbi:MAG: RHS repeat-associated core domain-containing protein [Ruminococcus sp.]|nr:RHS repeat-associated core domain-containing protein [Ruminococcus sp.]MEE0006397.1 RHS repeat-associated core domain-containing protein [Ruminococcus sp.]